MVSRENLERFFNSTFPVGPIDAPPISSDQEIQRLIFDEQNELYKTVNHGISLIVGRKGSGKTSLLNSASFEADSSSSVIISLDSGASADIFTRIVEEVEELSVDVALVEQVSNLWEVLIWGVVFKRLHEMYADPTIGHYIEGFGIDAFEGAPYEIIDKQIGIMKGLPPEARPLPQKVRYLKINNLTFLETRDRALKLLVANKRSVFVLVDSLEDYVLHKNQNAAALAGLLRCVGRITSERTPFLIRCCIPAEKYHELLRISQNPIKDFQGSILLHWDAGDLIKLSAKRYATYLRCYEPSFFDAHLKNLNLESRRESFLFWERIFPTTIENRHGVKERPIAYILRHTQLLPRHFILILTEILRRSIKVDHSSTALDARHIVDGVYEAETHIREQILQAYRTPFEYAEAACDQLLRELKTHFTWSDFDAAASRRKDQIKQVDHFELMASLIEIGAVGRYISETERYFIAVFEYMVPHRLSVSSRDSFCVHPLFSQSYGVNARYPGAKPVYTYWSETIPDELL